MEDLSLIVILTKRKQNVHCGFQRDFTEPSHLILTRVLWVGRLTEKTEVTFVDWVLQGTDSEVGT